MIKPHSKKGIIMNYSDSTPFTRYELDVEAARADLKHHGVDLKLAADISLKIAQLTSEYGDCPEVALACVATGYNSKCMAKQDSEFAYSNQDKKDDPLYESALAFQVVDAIVSRHESDIYEVISSWRN